MNLGSPPRIITGIAKGKKLKVPDTARPITDRVKTTIFDMLGEFVEGAEVLDLFAGSATMGLEALSRGAKSALFIEADHQAIEIIKENIESTGFKESAKATEVKAEKFLNNTNSTFDLIFIDPPFIKTAKFDNALLLNIMGNNSLVVFRSPEIMLEIPEEMELIEMRDMGSSRVWYIRLKAE